MLDDLGGSHGTIFGGGYIGGKNYTEGIQVVFCAVICGRMIVFDGFEQGGHRADKGIWYPEVF